MHENSFLSDWERVSSLPIDEKTKVFFIRSLSRLKIKKESSPHGLRLHPESDKIIVS